jgi:hypothetical protein
MSNVVFFWFSQQQGQELHYNHFSGHCMSNVVFFWFSPAAGEGAASP